MEQKITVQYYNNFENIQNWNAREKKKNEKNPKINMFRRFGCVLCECFFRVRHLMQSKQEKRVSFECTIWSSSLEILLTHATADHGVWNAHKIPWASTIICLTAVLWLFEWKTLFYAINCICGYYRHNVHPTLCHWRSLNIDALFCCVLCFNIKKRGFTQKKTHFAGFLCEYIFFNHKNEAIGLLTHGWFFST